MNFISKYKFQIIALMLFAFIFYSGCTTTNIGRVKGDDISIVNVDSLYYGVTNENDTINFKNTSPVIKTYDDTYDADITYKVNDSTGLNKLTRKINSDSLKFIYAKYTHATTWDVIKTGGIIFGGLVILLYTLLIIGFVNGPGISPH